MKLYPLAAAMLCAAPYIHAQEAVEPVIVTASRVAESADETLAAVTVIDRAQIERSQAQTLSDLLRATPGIALDVNGGRGKLANLHLRGTEANHTLVLVDGMKIGSATNAQVSLQDIPVEQIERIEVVRGPRSSLYGSDAIGGVIQIFTRRAEAGLTPNARITVGSFGTREISAGVSGRGESSWYSVQAQGVETDGFDVCLDCAQPDKDGYQASSASVRMGHRFNSGIEAEVNALRSESENEFDDDSSGGPNEAESVLQVVGGRIGYAVADFWHAALSVGQSRDESDNYRDGTFFSNFDTVRENASLQNDLGFGEHLLTLGFDYQKDSVTSTADYDVDSRINRGLFGQYRTAFGAHDLQLAVRTDDNQQFGYHRTGNLSWGVGVNEDLRLTAAYGTAFKAPTFNDLYWPFAGNPELEPETASSTEIGLQTLRGPMRVDLRLFRTEVDNLINWACTVNCDDADWSNDIWQPMNVNRARIDGIELALNGDVAGWDTRLAITVLDPRNAITGNLLARRSREAARVDADRDLGAYRIGATLIAEGKRFDDPANTRELPGYAVVDLRGDRALARDWRLGARIENLLDQEYRTATRFAQPERSYYVTLSYAP